MADRILSGMRPTGMLHLGNLEGALRNWVSLQDRYEAFYFVADWHFLTTGYEDSPRLRELVREVIVDFLSAGIDPEKATVFVQSDVKEHAELFLLLSMITPVSWLERVPTYKEVQEQLHIESPGYGLLGYPVLQAADILIYKANFVPVGKDQVPHLELTREIARRFNHLYGDVFPEPQPLLTEFPAVPGIDGRKMSKSYGNEIAISEEPDSIRRKVRMMFTDPEKIRRGDPGHPERCPVFALQNIYNGGEKESISVRCRTGELGCVDCKSSLAEAMISALAPIRERRKELMESPQIVDEVIKKGAERARAIASETLKEVRRAMGVS